METENANVNIIVNLMKGRKGREKRKKETIRVYLVSLSRQLLFDSPFDFLFFEGEFTLRTKGAKWSVEKNFTTLKETCVIFTLKKSTESTLPPPIPHKIYFPERKWEILQKKKLGYLHSKNQPSASIIIKHVQRALKNRKKKKKKKEEKSRRMPNINRDALKC